MGMGKWWKWGALLPLIVVSTFAANSSQAKAPSGDMSPAWSPAGDDIAYDSDRAGDTEIYVLNLSSGGVSALTDNTASDLGPSWSPDGERLAFYSSRDGNFEIYMMGNDGLAFTRLTQRPAIDWTPAWSPDGNMLVFESWRGGQPDLYAIDVETKAIKRLTNTPWRESHPDWSENGVAFGSLQSGKWGIFLLQPGQESAVQLVSGLGIDPHPAWSPDGKRLAYTVVGNGSTDIRVVNRDGSAGIMVSDDAYQDDFASWSGDGKRLAFSSKRQDRWRIFIRAVTLP